MHLNLRFSYTKITTWTFTCKCFLATFVTACDQFMSYTKVLRDGHAIETNYIKEKIDKIF